MSEVTFEEMKSKSTKDLENQIDLWKDELTKITFESNLQKKAEKPHLFKHLKRQIARAKTLIREKEMQGA